MPGEVQEGKLRAARRGGELLQRLDHRLPVGVLEPRRLQPELLEAPREVGRIAPRVGQRGLPAVFRVADDQSRPAVGLGTGERGRDSRPGRGDEQSPAAKASAGARRVHR